MSTPGDSNQRSWEQQTQQGGIPWYAQPRREDRPPPPQSPQPPPRPYPGAYPGAGQYQQPQYGQPPAQWSQPSPTPAAEPSKASGSGGKRFLIGSLIAAVLIIGVVAVLLVTGVLNQDTKKIAVAGVQTEVQQVLVDRITGYTSDDIKDVKCNNGQDPTVEKGGSFSCDVTVRGKQHKLTVTFQDDNGTYSVGLPQLSGGK